MGEYQGQPEYVKVGFQVDLLDPWVRIEGSEWGDLLSALHAAAEHALSASDQEKVAVLVGWIREELGRAFDEEWWGMQDDYVSDIKVARAQTPKTIESWRERAKAFKGEAALEEVIAALPGWIQFDPERDALTKEDDSRYATYLRLKKEFDD